MKRSLLLDTETTGVDLNGNVLVEIAVILYSLEFATPITTYSSLIPGDKNPSEEFNGIPSLLLKQSTSLGVTCAVLDELQMSADIIVAHSAKFDHDYVAREKYWGFDWDRLPWACTMRDVKWPKTGNHRNLVALALMHGVPVVAAHRALTDCDILSRLLTRVSEQGVDLVEMFERALRHKALVEALTGKAEKDITYRHGFDYDSKQHMTLREMPIEDIADLPFKCKVLKDSVPSLGAPYVH